MEGRHLDDLVEHDTNSADTGYAKIPLIRTRYYNLYSCARTVFSKYGWHVGEGMLTPSDLARL